MKDLQLVGEVEKQASDPVEVRLTKIRILNEQVLLCSQDTGNMSVTLFCCQDRMSHLDDIVAAADGVLDCVF